MCLKKIYFIMGVSGCGKTTIAQMLAQHLDIQYFDGDDFHSTANVQKMATGIPLTDADRLDWLKSLNLAAQQCVSQQQSAIFACSALKESYRQILMQTIENQSVLIYLKGDFETILQRMKARKNHFMPVELLKSQFDILEVPQHAITIGIKNQPNIIIQKIMEKIQKKQFGIVGLGVMGKNLARNFGRNGVQLALFNRFVAGSEEKIAEKAISTYSELQSALGFEDLKSFVLALERPRKIFLMIKAGTDTDAFIAQIAPYLEPDDILIDGGNTHFSDTKHRMLTLKAQNVHLIGTGVSGGEQGALNGPSIMPSGDASVYKQIEPYLNAIAAKDKDGKPCCIYIGVEGAGHFVKMIHNGIEYAEMQLIAEIYAYFRYIMHLQPNQISAIFSEWAQGDLKSYLLEITASILLKKENGAYIIDQILDKAGNKGTGNWATITSSELGIPATMITAALFARYVSTIKSDFDKMYHQNGYKTQHHAAIADIKNAYTLARIVNHQQGFLIMRTASETFKWQLNLSEIARIWTNGCIIRSVLMEKLVSVCDKNKDLFENEVFLKQVQTLKSSLKTFCMTSMQQDLPIPCHGEALNYLNTLTGNRPTANIIQAQRDFFGAHTYQKVNDKTGKFYHTDWA
jgi:6-phosphogluconate dehydrogenase